MIRDFKKLVRIYFILLNVVIRQTLQAEIIQWMPSVESLQLSKWFLPMHKLFCTAWNMDVFSILMHLFHLVGKWHHHGLVSAVYFLSMTNWVTVPWLKLITSSKWFSPLGFNDFVAKEKSPCHHVISYLNYLLSLRFWFSELESLTCCSV